MAKVDPNSIIASMHGKICKRENITLTHRHGSTYAYQLTPAVDPGTPLQLSHRERFRRATRLALTDMRDPATKAHWTDIADHSDGYYKTPRGAAFAHYYKQLP